MNPFVLLGFSRFGLNPIMIKTLKMNDFQLIFLSFSIGAFWGVFVDSLIQPDQIFHIYKKIVDRIRKKKIRTFLYCPKCISGQTSLIIGFFIFDWPDQIVEHLLFINFAIFISWWITEKN